MRVAPKGHIRNSLVYPFNKTVETKFKQKILDPPRTLNSYGYFVPKPFFNVGIQGFDIAESTNTLLKATITLKQFYYL